MTSGPDLRTKLYEWIGPRAVILPLPFGEKGPLGLNGWQHLTFDKTQDPDYQVKLRAAIEAGGNLGVLLGDDVQTIDIDDDALVEPFLQDNPSLNHTLRTKGARGCQIWFRTKGDFPNRCCKLKGFGEWRGGGCQSVIWGKHPSGCRYRWIVAEPLVEIEFESIVWPVGLDLPWKDPKSPAAAPKTHVAIPEGVPHKRIAAYVAAVPGAVAGENGHGQTFKLACALIHGFSLSEGDAMHYLEIYNYRCEPPWSEKELGHKLADALKAPGNRPAGYLLMQETNSDKVATKVETTRTNGVADPDEKLTEAEYVSLFETQMPPFSVWDKHWRVFHDGIWPVVDRSIYEKVALDIQPEQSRTSRKARAILDHAEALHHLDQDSFKGACCFDKDDILICASNGILRVKPHGAVTLEPHYQMHHFTAKLGARYDPDAECPVFERTLLESLTDPEDRELFLLWMASILIPDSRYECALCCCGQTGTGKSSLAEGVSEAIGPDVTQRLTLKEICDDKGYSLPKLKLSMLNVSTELDAVVLEGSENFKRLISGEMIEAREIYGKPHKMAVWTKFLFLANQLPRFKHGTDAEKRRLRILLFSHSPAVPDPEVKATIKLEKDGILRLILEYLGVLLQRKSIPFGGAESRATLERFSETNDPIGSFVKNHCVLDREEYTAKETLIENFNQYLAHLGLPPMIADRFCKVIYDRHPSVRPERKRNKGIREQVVNGIGLKD